MTKNQVETVIKRLNAEIAEVSEKVSAALNERDAVAEKFWVTILDAKYAEVNDAYRLFNQVAI